MPQEIMPKERESSSPLSPSPSVEGNFWWVLMLFCSSSSTLDVFCLVSLPRYIPVSYWGTLEGQHECDLLEADPFSLSALLLNGVLEQMDGVSQEALFILPSVLWQHHALHRKLINLLLVQGVLDLWEQHRSGGWPSGAWAPTYLLPQGRVESSVGAEEGFCTWVASQSLSDPVRAT